MVVPASLRVLWRYRQFIAASARREFVARYTGSALGLGWNFVQPAVTVVIYTVIFGALMHARLPGIEDQLAYGIYLSAGLFTWNLFAEVATRTSTVFVDNANLLKKANFPRIALPAIVVVSALVNFSLLAGLFLVVLLVTGRWPGWALLGCIPLLAVQVSLAVGIGMLAGVTHVFFRDAGQLLAMMLQFWFWLSPIVYTPGIVQEPYRDWLTWNPLYPIVRGYQELIVLHGEPDWPRVAMVAGIAALVLGAGFRAFRARSGDIVDEL